jgi:hypothetical protein
MKHYTSWGPNNIQQADLVGPRFLKSDGRFYSLNVMDIDTHRVQVNPCRSKADIEIAQALIHSWQHLGCPEFLQMDNELSFRGSNRYPHSFGIVIRLCLLLRIQPLFIPLGEPWRNGCIERFQDVFDKVFFRSQQFPNYEILSQEAEKFSEFHNANYVYSALEGKTPQAALGNQKIDLLPKEFQLPKDKIPIEDGVIHLFRFIRSDRILNVFGEHYTVLPELIYEYVHTKICTEIHELQVWHDNRVVQRFPYPIPMDVDFEIGLPMW